MLAMMWSKENIPPLLLGMQTYIATTEINMAVHKKIGNQSPQDATSTFSCIAKGHSILLQEYLVNLISSAYQRSQQMFEELNLVLFKDLLVLR